jgi:hypothetical protein
MHKERGGAGGKDAWQEMWVKKRRICKLKEMKGKSFFLSLEIENMILGMCSMCWI